MNNLKIPCPFLKYIVGHIKMFKQYLSLVLALMFLSSKRDCELVVQHNFTLKKSLAVDVFLTGNINLSFNSKRICSGKTI